MAGIPFQDGRRASGPPEIRSNQAIQASATFLKGAILKRDTVPQEIEEHAGGSSVTGIVGVALHGVTSGVPEAKGSYGYGTTCSFIIPNPDQEFVGQLVSAALPVLAPATTDIGVSYGVVKGSDSVWYVDRADTSDVVVRVTKIDINTKLVWFKFLPAAVAS